MMLMFVYGWVSENEYGVPYILPVGFVLASSTEEARTKLEAMGWHESEELYVWRQVDENVTRKEAQDKYRR